MCPTSPHVLSPEAPAPLTLDNGKEQNREQPHVLLPGLSPWSSADARCPPGTGTELRGKVSSISLNCSFRVSPIYFPNFFLQLLPTLFN